MPEKLYLIDGHAQVHRAYHAYPRLMSPSGEPTGAVFGFATMLMAMLKRHKPDYVVAVFDPRGPTERQSIFPQYKATRKPMPEDLRPQVDRILKLCEGYRVPTVRLDGIEADDVLGTLAKQAAAKGLEVVLVSSDKDLMQVVGGNIRMYDPHKDKLLDAEGVLKEKGLKPEQIPDWLGLMGDTSDNIPGVPGIGEKGAKELLAKYGTMEEVIAHAGEIKGKRGENLKLFADQARASKDLATLRLNVKTELDLEAARVKPPDSKALVEMFSELRFNDLLKTVSATSEGIESKYTTVDKPDALRGFLAALKVAKRFALDTETDGLNPRSAKLAGLSFSWAAGEAYYIPVRGPVGDATLPEEEVIAALKPILEDASAKKVGQNIKFDQLVLRRVGVELAGADFDTMVAGYLLNPGMQTHSLDALALEHLQIRKIRTEEVIGSGRNQTTMDRVPVKDVARYSCEDADVTWRLFELLSRKLAEAKLDGLFREVEMPLVPVLADMEWTGVKVDAKVLDRMSKELEEMLAAQEKEIEAAAGEPFNVNSPQQLREILYEKLKLVPAKKTQKTRTASTDAEALEALAEAHPLPALVLEYRSLAKIKGTYVDALPGMIDPGTGRIHASFNQTQAATGRLSSSDPNLQNIPIRSDLGRSIRAAFVAGEPGWKILGADYSQIELRVLAHYSQDPKLIESFERGEDIHTAVAARLFGVEPSKVKRQQRAQAKAVNFGIIYGQTAFGLSKELKIEPREAQKIIDAYFNEHSKVRECLDGIVEAARRDGFVVTILGRRRFIPELSSGDHVAQKQGERFAVNTVFQGSAADLIKKAMAQIHSDLEGGASPRKGRRGWQARMILQIHDELLFEVPEDEVEGLRKLVKDRMENALRLRVPLVVDVGVGDNWLEAK